MKKLLALTLALALAFGLAACFGGGGNTEAPTTESTPAEPDITTIADYEPAPTDPDFDAAALFKSLEGYWNDTYLYPGFVSFEYREGKPILWGGVYDGEGNQISELAGGADAGDGMVTLNFIYPAITEDNSFDGYYSIRPEMTETVLLDLAGLEAGSIRVRRASPYWSRDWHTYTYGGKTMSEAAGKSFNANVLMGRLEGLWNVSDGESGWFLRFDAYQGFNSGVWDSEGSGFGALTGGISTGENTAALTFVFPAWEGELARPETTVTMEIDFTDLDSGGTIEVKFDKTLFGGNEEWNTFVYGG